jgi:LysM repeat protein
VYLHHVRKTDTLPLIVLAYQISAPVLKKANRLWATDSILTRDVLHLPVQECSITPEKCEAPIRDDTENKAREREDERMQVNSHNEGSIFDGPGPSSGRIKDDQGMLSDQEEWVMIPGIGQVEIIALPAHKLSYFPTKQVPMERTTSLPTLDALVQADKTLPRDSMDSSVSRSSLGSLVEDGVGRVVRFWQDNQGKRKWAKIGSDQIEL